MHILYAPSKLVARAALATLLGGTALPAVAQQPGVPSSKVAHGRISGRVLSEADQPLTDLNVALLGTTRGTATDEQGSFELGRVPVGSYTLVVSGLGYATTWQTVLVEAGQTATVRLHMAASTQQLSEVSVEGQRATPYKVDKPSESLRLQTSLLETPQSIVSVPKEVLQNQ